MRNDCPDAVKTPPMIFVDENTDNQMETSMQHDADALGNSTSTPVQHTPKLPQALVDKSLQDGETVPEKATMESQHRQEEEESAREREKLEADDSEFSASSASELGDTPDASVFLTDEEEIKPRSKRLHSPDCANDKKQKPSIPGETFNCFCGNTITPPCAAGLSSLCACGRLYAKCACENVVSTFGDMPANCEKCRKPVARRHLDVTM